MTEPSWCWAGLNKGDDKSSWWWQQSRSVAVWVAVMGTDISKADCVCVRGVDIRMDMLKGIEMECSGSNMVNPEA